MSRNDKNLNIPDTLSPNFFRSPSPVSPVRGNDEKTISKKRTLDNTEAKSENETETKVDKFFSEVIKKIRSLLDLSGKAEPIQVQVILVVHIVPTLKPFLQALKTIPEIELTLIIPKGNSTDTKLILREEEKVSLHKLLENNDWLDNNGEKDNFREIIEKNYEDIIRKLISEDKKFLVVDIGGYFSSCFFDLGKKFPGRFLGVVEDTENGHDKYQKAINTQPESDEFGEMKQDLVGKIPRIISVARSHLKKTEDYNVGKSIVEAADTMLRVEAHTMLERMHRIGVLGFGKIGRSIAEHLRQKNVRQIFIYDCNNAIQMEACSLGFCVVDRNDMLQNVDMLFCATGRYSLQNETYRNDFNALKDNVFIASCTSADDEFELGDIADDINRIDITAKQNGIQNVNQDKIYKIRLPESKKRVNFLRKGNAVNFAYGAVNGPYIYSVQAGLIAGLLCLVSEKPLTDSDDQKKLRIEEFSNECGKLIIDGISEVWLTQFENYECAPLPLDFNNTESIREKISELPGDGTYWKDFNSIIHKNFWKLMCWLKNPGKEKESSEEDLKEIINKLINDKIYGVLFILLELLSNNINNGIDKEKLSGFISGISLPQPHSNQKKKLVRSIRDTLENIKASTNPQIEAEAKKILYAQGPSN